MFERITMVFKAMIDALLGKFDEERELLEGTHAERQSYIISAHKELARLLAEETQLQKVIETVEEKKNTLESYGASAAELTALTGQLKQLQKEIANVRRKLNVLEEMQQATSKANEILSRSTPDGALSIMDRIESKTNEKNERSNILAAKAITDIGTTHDHEVHPGPIDDPKEIEIRIRRQLIVLLVIVAIMGLLAYVTLAFS